MAIPPGLAVDDPLAQVALLAASMLRAFVAPGADHRALTEALRPREDDHARVFVPHLTPAIAVLYESFWKGEPVLRGRPHQLGLRVKAWRAGDADLPPVFPAPWRDLGGALVPDVVWCVVKFVSPGAMLGTSFDGIARVGDRFAWFPRPYEFAARAMQARA